MTAIGAATLVIAAGCATPLVFKSTPWAETKEGQTLFVVSYQLEAKGADVPANCVFKMRKVADGKLYGFPVSAGSKQTVLEVSPDLYQIDSLACKDVDTWSLKELFKAPVEARPAQVGFVGHFIFRFTPGSMKNVEATRNEKAAALRAIFDLMPKKLRANVINASSGSVITMEATARKNQQRELKLSYRQGETVRTSDLNTQLDKCDAAEREINNVAIGTLSYEISYDQGRLDQMKQTAAEHTFTPSYVSCVEAVFHDFRPGSELPLSYRITL